jgi:type I restriction enzyme, S subunit
VRSSIKSLSDEGLEVSRPLPKDSVLVVCIGATIGKTAMTLVDLSTTNQQINTIIPNSDIVDSHFLYYALSSRATELPRLAGRAAVPIVNKAVFSQFLVPFPPLPEQSKVARILSAVDSKIEAEKA